jgi:hypothetical protein
MTYELKSYLKAINQTKEPLMDGDDEEWERKYPPFIVNKCVGAFPDTIMLVNEINQLPNVDRKLQFDFLINSNVKAKAALDILSDDQLATIRKRLYKGGKNGRD